ncbi:MAG: hypothetical protein JWM11_874, partial [Planctomycetaceae bacterium]|nr:hypothetical protein [Planctomycetaceae bacterium]
MFAESESRDRSLDVNTYRTLTFLWTPWSVAISVVLVLATAGFCYEAWRRSGFRRSFGLLELLRLLLVIFAALLLNQPEWIEEFRPQEKPSIAVLWDASISMNTRDAVPGAKTGTSTTVGGAPVTRRDAIASLIQQESWSKLAERLDVVIQPFAEPQPGHGSDLHEPLAKAPEKFKNL